MHRFKCKWFRGGLGARDNRRSAVRDALKQLAGQARNAAIELHL